MTWYKKTIFVIGILYSTLGMATADQCENIFISASVNKQKNIDTIKASYQPVQKSNGEWPDSSEIFVYTEGQNRFAVSAQSKVKVKIDNHAVAAFLTEPAIPGLSQNKVIIESIVLSTLGTDIKTVRTTKYDEHDNSFNNDYFLKFKSGSQDFLLRRSDLSQYKIGNDFIRAYDVDTAKNIFAIQAKDLITVYINGQVEFEYQADNLGDIKIVGYSQAESAYIAYDSKNERLFSILSIWKNSIDKVLEQKVGITFFKPRMVGKATLLFQSVDHKFYVWSLRKSEAVPMRGYIAEGVSLNSKYVAVPTYNKNNSEWAWEFKEINYGL